MSLRIDRIGPNATLQDLGRPGYMALGLGQGGAVDRRAVFEAAALLGSKPLPAIEMALGGVFTALVDMQVAVTGLPAKLTIGGASAQWNCAHPVSAGQTIEVGAVAGFSYLTVAGGFDVAPVMGSVSVHLAGGIGAPLEAGMVLPCDGGGAESPRVLRHAHRQAAVIRVAGGPQTASFDAEVLGAFQSTTFTRSAKGNRQGVRLDHDGAPFASPAQLSRLSDFITVGDIQMTGEGTPFVLLSECQTIGGYPRIGTVIPEDLPFVAQAQGPLRFRILDGDELAAAYRSEAQILAALRSEVAPLVRDPASIHDLLSYTLVDGFITGDEEWL